jgi:repressor LexA
MEKKSLVELLTLAQGNRSLNTFARQSGVDPGNLSRILKGQRPTPEVLKKLADSAENGVRYEILMDAAGYMDYVQAISRANKIASVNETRSNMIPVLGLIRAGLPFLAEENWEYEIELPSDTSADFALYVKGDSMSWAGIHEGDLALMRQTETASYGMIVAAGVQEMEWEATLKFYVLENGQPVLRAANPNYEAIKMTKKHRIIGQLVKVIKEPPTYSVYKNHLVNKEMTDKGWSDAIETAIQYGFDGENLKKAIEVLGSLKKF